jgi:hypothetical protein
MHIILLLSLRLNGDRSLCKCLHFQQPTIDVEAAIRNGRLDFGLFAPESRLDRDTAETVIGAMRREMSALVTGFESI